MVLSSRDAFRVPTLPFSRFWWLVSNIVLAIASYNAGPGATSQWVTPLLEKDPELWVERIPYPETRLYTKKVLGNLWAYLGSGRDRCDSGSQRVR